MADTEGGAAEKGFATEKNFYRHASSLTEHGTQPAQTAPPSVTRSPTASASLASLGLAPRARGPARAHGNNTGGSGDTGPHAPASTPRRVTAPDAPPPLGPFDTHCSARAAPPLAPPWRPSGNTPRPPQQQRPYATAPATVTTLPPTPRPLHPHASRQTKLPLLSGHSIRTPALTRTRLATPWHASGNTPRPPPNSAAINANWGLWSFNRQIEKPKKTSKINHRPCPQKTAVTSKAAR